MMFDSKNTLTYIDADLHERSTWINPKINLIL